MTNFENTQLLLNDLAKERKSQYSQSRNGMSGMYFSGRSITDFMGINPNLQLAYAEENELFPQNEEYYK